MNLLRNQREREREREREKIKKTEMEAYRLDEYIGYNILILIQNEIISTKIKVLCDCFRKFIIVKKTIRCLPSFIPLSIPRTN